VAVRRRPQRGQGAELYHDDAVLEFPQSGERFAGRANIQGWRQRYPARLDFEPRKLRGPDWRRPWADGGIPERRGDLPATIRGGS
jgi:hypothetical protein